jgi:hypothetical protein
MAFTNVTLNTQPLLESTFISDMRLILNANVSVIKGKVEDLINTFEIDLTNKYIGVDNYFNQVKTNNVILGNSISFMDSTNTIGSLTKSAGKSILSIDKLIIQAGGTIDMSGTANTMAIKRLGVGIPLASVTADGFYVGSSTVSVPSQFNGEAAFPKQAITQSTEGSTNTVITTTALNTGGTDYYYGVLKLTKSSKQFIYLTVRSADTSPSSSKPVIIFTYEDPANRPDPGQTFTVVIRDYQTSAGIDVAVASWGPIRIVPGFTNSATGTPVLLDGSTLGVAATPTAAIAALSHYIQLFNGNVQSGLGTSDLGGSALRRFGSSVSLTKYETIGSPTVTSSRFVITSSHNIKTVN